MKLTDRKINLLNSLIIIISLFLVYSNSFNNSFNWDDTYLIQNNPRIEKIENYIFTDSWFRIFNNRSLSLLSFAINYQLSGLNEFGYHLFNLIIHILSSVTLYFLALKLINQPGVNKVIEKKHYSLFALITALIFAMHPIQTDAVTYITQRMASMAGFFVILSTYIYSLFRTSSSNTKKFWWLIPLLLSFTAGFLSKETGLTAFFTIILVEFFFLRNLSGKIENRYLFVLLALLILPPLIYSLVSGFPSFTSEHTFSEYIFTQQKVILQYIGLLFYPLTQHPAHLIPPELHLLSLSVIVPLLIHIILIGFAIFLADRHKIVSFGILWFYLALLLESSFIPLPYFMNEYRIYTSIAGFAWIVAYTALYFVNKIKKFYPVYLVGFIIILLGFFTWQRNFVWKNAITLWSDNVEKSPENFEAYNALGYSYYLKGDYYKALDVLNRAVELKPDYINANLNRGTVLSDLNLDSLALMDFENVLKKDTGNYFALANKGAILAKRGNMELAKDFFILSLKSNPVYYRSHFNLGMYYQTKNNFDSSYYYYSQSILHNPRFWGAYNNRAVILIEKKKYLESLKDLQEAINLRPFYIEAYINLAIVYRDMNDFENALQNHNYSLTINPQSNEALYQRSITFLKMNRKDLAQKDLEAILALYPDDPRALSYLQQLKKSD